MDKKLMDDNINFLMDKLANADLEAVKIKGNIIEVRKNNRDIEKFTFPNFMDDINYFIRAFYDYLIDGTDIEIIYNNKEPLFFSAPMITGTIFEHKYSLIFFPDYVYKNCQIDIRRR